MNNTNNSKSLKAKGQPTAKQNDATPTTPTASSQSGPSALHTVIVHSKLHRCTLMRIAAKSVSQAEAKARRIGENDANHERWEVVGVEVYAVHVGPKQTGGRGNE